VSIFAIKWLKVLSDGRGKVVAARRASGWPAVLVAAALILASVLPIAWLEARPRNDRDVAVMFASWTTRGAVLARVTIAEGFIAAEGILDSIVVVHGGSAGLIGRLYAAGARAVVDPVAFGGCLVRSPRRTT
jgi:hypothetical protein